MCASPRDELGGRYSGGGECSPGERGWPALITTPRLLGRIFAFPLAPATVEAALYESASNHCSASAYQQPCRAARIDLLLIDFPFHVSCPHVWIG